MRDLRRSALRQARPTATAQAANEAPVNVQQLQTAVGSGPACGWAAGPCSPDRSDRIADALPVPMAGALPRGTARHAMRCAAALWGEEL
jgi:hypothetical protein